MTYEAVLKQNKGFTVPEAIFNEKYDRFAAAYDGKIGGENHPAWRAFEIAYKQGKLDGDTRPDDKSSRRSSKTRFGGRSKASDDGVEQVDSDSDGGSKA